MFGGHGHSHGEGGCDHNHGSGMMMGGPPGGGGAVGDDGMLLQPEASSMTVGQPGVVENFDGWQLAQRGLLDQVSVSEGVCGGSM